MTLAKVVVSGVVTKAPEKRFTQNNLPVASFVIDINPQDETLVRVLALGALADRTADTLFAGDTALVEGRLQTASVKTTNGKERRILEINANSVEKVSFQNSQGGYQQMGNYNSAGNSYGYNGGNFQNNYQMQNNPNQQYPNNYAPQGGYQNQNNFQQPMPQNQPLPPQNDIVQFGTDEISEDLIDEDEIPF